MRFQVQQYYFVPPARIVLAKEICRFRSVQCVLDVGCGQGQELHPFSAQGATAIALDPNVAALEAGRAMYARWDPTANVHFVQGVAERLPFLAESFDLVISRVSLPYTDNRQALFEMARVLRPGGVLLLQIHHPSYYVQVLWHAALRLALLKMVYATRVLLAGMLYYVLGRQIRNRLVGFETFQTRRMLEHELKRYGLEIIRQVGGGLETQPCFLAKRRTRLLRNP